MNTIVYVVDVVKVSVHKMQIRLPSLCQKILPRIQKNF